MERPRAEISAGRSEDIRRQEQRYPQAGAEMSARKATFLCMAPPTCEKRKGIVFHMEKNRTKRRQAIAKYVFINI